MKLRSYFKKYHVVLFVIFFGFGFLWGKFYYYGDRQPLEVFGKRELHVLAPPQIISDDVLENYHMQHQTQIYLDLYETDEDFKEKMNSKEYDVVFSLPDLSKDLILQEKLMKLSDDNIKNKKQISPDFSTLPYDKGLDFVIPVFWGLRGIVFNKQKTKKNEFLEARDISKTAFKDKALLSIPPLSVLADVMQKLRDETLWIAHVDSYVAYELMNVDEKFDFTIAPEGATLWTANVGVFKASKNPSSALSFIEFLLQKEIMIELVKHNKLSTTHRDLDTENIKPYLKSSFIREVSLKDLRY